MRNTRGNSRAILPLSICPSAIGGTSKRTTVYVQQQYKTHVSTSRGDYLEGLVGVNPVEVRVLFPALYTARTYDDSL